MLDMRDWSAVSQAVEWLPWDRRSPGTGVPKLPPLKNDATVSALVHLYSWGYMDEDLSSVGSWKSSAGWASVIRPECFILVTGNDE